MFVIGMSVFCNRMLTEIVNLLDILDASVRHLSPEVSYSAS